MKSHILFVITMIFFILNACSSKKVMPSIEEQQSALDSIIEVKKKAILLQQDEILKDRMAIEVKELTDSLLNNKQQLPQPQPINSDTGKIKKSLFK